MSEEQPANQESYIQYDYSQQQNQGGYWNAQQQPYAQPNYQQNFPVQNQVENTSYPMQNSVEQSSYQQPAQEYYQQNYDWNTAQPNQFNYIQNVAAAPFPNQNELYSNKNLRYADDVNNPSMQQQQIQTPMKTSNKEITTKPGDKSSLRRSVLPSHNFKKKSKATKPVERYQEQDSYAERPSSRGSGSSEPDQYVQWFEMLTDYYKRYYPDYEMPDLRQMAGKKSGLDYASVCFQYYLHAQRQWSDSFGMVSMVEETSNGRRTPQLYHTPHINASISTPGLLIQLLPSRPMDGDSARVEILDLNQLANEAIAEATYRVSNAMNKMYNSSKGASMLQPDMGYTQDTGQSAEMEGADVSADGTASAGLSSQLEQTDEEEEEALICADITTAWDRVDHVFFPGPLSRNQTVKADILAYLREKLNEVQDKLPVDWESASLLFMYLELLVKNNGVIQSSDLVNILLDGIETRTADLREKSMSQSGLQNKQTVNNSNNQRIPLSKSQYAAMNSNVVYDQNGYPEPINRMTMSTYNGSMAEQLNALPGQNQQVMCSGRQTPSDDTSMISGHAGGRRVGLGRRVGSSASDAGPTHLHSLIRRAAQATAMMINPSGDRELEDKATDRYRQLLMNAMPTKALDHACRNHLWGHAFALAHRMKQPQLVEKVMERFMRNALHQSDPVLTLYQISACEMPQIVNTVAYCSGPDGGEWRPHLSVLIAMKQEQPDLVQASLERLADSLMSRQLVYAAHLCYLLMDQVAMRRSNVTGRYQLPGKIWLIGHAQMDASEASTSAKSADKLRLDENVLYDPKLLPTEAIQLTEIYEYICKLKTNDEYVLIQLLPYKMSYVIRLVDSGLCETAFKYLECIGRTLTEYFKFVCGDDHNRLLSDRELAVDFYRLANLCVTLALRLEHHPDVVSQYGQSMNDFESEETQNRAWVEELMQINEHLCEEFNLPSWRRPFGHGMGQESHCKTPEPVNNAVEEVQALTTNFEAQAQISDPNQSVPNVTGNFEVEGQRFNNQMMSNAPDSHQSSPRKLHQLPPENQAHSNAMYQMQSSPSSMPSQAPSPPQHSTPTHKVPSHHPGPINTMAFPSQGPPAEASPSMAASLVTPRPSEPHHQPRPIMPRSRNASMCSNAGNQPPPPPNMAFFNPAQFIPQAADMNASPGYQHGGYDFFANMPHARRSRNPSSSSHMGNTGQHQRSRLPSNSSIVDGSGAMTGDLSSPSYHQLQHGPTHSSHLSTVKESTSTTVNQAPPRPHPNDLDDDSYAPNASSKAKPTPTNAANKDANSDQTDGKEGWIGSLFGKFKRPKNVYLPDDSQPSLIWDDEKKRWIDKNNPNAEEEVPPPPPVLPGMSSMMGMPAPGGPMDSSSEVPIQKAPAVPKLNTQPASSKTRSRYVNVLADQTSGPAISGPVTTGGLPMIPSMPMPQN